MNEHDRKSLDEFFKAIEPNIAAYSHASFSYLALRKRETFELTEGRLLLHVMPAPVPSEFFQSENVRAGSFRLNEMELSPKGVIESLLAGNFIPAPGDKDEAIP